MSRILLAVVGSLSLIASISCASAADYHLVRSIPIVGEGGWDYLTFDGPRHRLFIARSTRVQVVDPDDGRLLGEIPDTPGVHGIALAQDVGKGYVSDGKADAVTVFDLATLRVLQRIDTPSGKKPDFIAYDEGTKRILVFNGAGRNVTVINVETDHVAATIALDGAPESAVIDRPGHVIVALEDRDALASFEESDSAVVSRWPLPGCTEPAGLAIDRTQGHLFVACHNRSMLIVSADNGKVIARVPIGQGVDATVFDEGRRFAFSSQGDGTLTVVGSDGSGGYAVAQTVATALGARTMALDPRRHDLYLVTAAFDEPAPGHDADRPRRTVRPGSFKLLVVRSPEY